MRMYDIIEKKRRGKPLTREEIGFFVNGCVAGKIPDYQVSALLMAICLREMDDRETADLTACMADSGERVDLSSIPGVKVDKHSTGGVGDKTTLIVSPVAASLGVRVAKMSGRGLGYTGGTIDKLESIPGMRTSIGRERFLEIVRRVGFSIISQSGNLAPADKKLYALRDVTATVESIPLIASSIMSKKIAAGSDCILLDVKTGSGAFMKTADDAFRLARTMVSIGENAGRKTVALVTDMNEPLGMAIGNSLEVAEACRTLKGKGPKDLTGLCVELAAHMLSLAGRGDLESCRTAARGALADGSAFAKLKEMVEAQGGDVSVLDDPKRFPKAKACLDIAASTSGYLYAMDAGQWGVASMQLGAGRRTKDDGIDGSAGIVLHKKTGDFVNAGEPFATLYASSEDLCREAERTLLRAVEVREEKPARRPLVFARVTKDGVWKP